MVVIDILKSLVDAGGYQIVNIVNNNERPKLWKPRALCSKDVAKHTIYGVYFVIICAQENVGL